MAHRILFFIGVFLLSNVFADILFQHDYMDPMPPFVPGDEDQQSEDPGYHIELHPVYMPRSAARNVGRHGLLSYRPILPFLPEYHRPVHYSKLGGYSYLHPSLFIRHPYHPLVEHHRYSRSTREKSTSGPEAEPVKNDVASKPSLNERFLPVIDSRKQKEELSDHLDEKHVKVRQSKDDYASVSDLLNMAPSNMYSPYDEYHLTDADSQELNSNLQKFINNYNLEVYPGTSPTNSPDKLRKEATHNRDELSHAMNTENLHLRTLHKMTPYNWQPQRQFLTSYTVPTRLSKLIRSDYMDSNDLYENEYPRSDLVPSLPQTIYKPLVRNFPDPRPLPSSKPSKTGASHQSGTQSSEDSGARMMDEEGERSEKDKIEDTAKCTEPCLLNNLYSYSMFGYPYLHTDYNVLSNKNYGYPYTNFGYMVYKTDCGTSNNLASTQVTLPKILQYYQDPHIEGNEISKYIASVENNEDASYGVRYLEVPTYRASSPLKFYLQQSGKVPYR